MVKPHGEAGILSDDAAKPQQAMVVCVQIREDFARTAYADQLDAVLTIEFEAARRALELAIDEMRAS